MPQADAPLYCSNYNCQAPNPEANQVCQQCGTRLRKFYLWATGPGVGQYAMGTLLGDRYLVKHPHIVLDTKPFFPPETPDEIPLAVRPYLRLFTHRCHVPQVYDVLQLFEGGKSVLESVLLEQGPWLESALKDFLKDAAQKVPTGISQDEVSDALPRLNAGPTTLELPSENSWEGVTSQSTAPFSPPLFPALEDVWSKASAFCQLTFLWQMAGLWQPCVEEGVGWTLLSPSLLRVGGSTIRLLELRANVPLDWPLDSLATGPTEPSPSLTQLGAYWLTWLPQVRPSIAGFFEHLCQGLIRGEMEAASQVIAALDQALAFVGRSHTRQIHMATLTDQGPSRSHNEDACYPPSGTVLTDQTPQANTLSIVCDGLGGHEGGGVASTLAIEAVREFLEKYSLNPDQSTPINTPATTLKTLKEAIYLANDHITQRNDQEQRRDRQRMGTTLVMAVALGHELYLAHVGDSRAYWITPSGCCQLTVDDDIASREVRLGYAFYGDAQLQLSAGSLVQALGMGSARSLYTNMQRIVVAEDGVLLLCSDGLSDNDRVEEFWSTEILPILTGEVDLKTACHRLLDLANTHNGHDNVTISLLHYQIEEGQVEERQVKEGQVEEGDANEFVPLESVPIELAQPKPVTAVEGEASPTMDISSRPVTLQSLAPPSTIQSPPPSPMGSRFSHPEARGNGSLWKGLVLSLLGVFLLGAGTLAAYHLVPGMKNWIESLRNPSRQLEQKPLSNPPHSQPQTPPTPKTPSSPSQGQSTPQTTPSGQTPADTPIAPEEGTPKPSIQPQGSPSGRRSLEPGETPTSSPTLAPSNTPTPSTGSSGSQLQEAPPSEPNTP